MMEVELTEKERHDCDFSKADNIFNLAKKAKYKKILVKRDSWNVGNWCIVNYVRLNPSNQYGVAYGHIQYANGNTHHGKIDCAGNFSWQLIRILKEDMTVKS